MVHPVTEQHRHTVSTRWVTFCPLLVLREDLAVIGVDPAVAPEHAEGSPQTDGVSLEGRLPGVENVMEDTRPLLSLLQHHQPTPVPTVMVAGHTVSEPVVSLRDHQVLLVLHPGGATGGAVGVGVRTDIYPVHPGSDGRH